MCRWWVYLRRRSRTVTAGLTGVVRGTSRLRGGIEDSAGREAGEVSGLLGRGGKGHCRGSLAAVSEAGVVAEEENFISPPAEGDEWTAENDAVLVAVLDGFADHAGCGIGESPEESPGVEGGVAEELVDGTVVFVAALLDVEVLNALTFIDGGVSVGLKVELVDRFDGDGGPDEAGIAVASGTHEGNAVDVDVGGGPAAAGAVDDADVGGGIAVGVVALNAGHEEGEVSSAALVGLPVSSHLDGKG